METGLSEDGNQFISSYLLNTCYRIDCQDLAAIAVWSNLDNRVKQSENRSTKAVSLVLTVGVTASALFNDSLVDYSCK